MADLVREHGAEVSASMSGCVTHLLCGVDGEHTGKFRQAAQDGVPVVSESYVFGRIVGVGIEDVS